MQHLPLHKQLLAVLGLSCVALVLALLLQHSLSAGLPFTAAVLASAWFFGMRGGFSAIAIGGTLLLLFIFAGSNQNGWMDFAGFLLLNVAITVLVDHAKSACHRFGLMLESIADAVVVTDRRGDIQFMNGQAEALLGVTLAKVRRRHVSSVVKFSHHTSAKAFELPVAELLRGEAPPTSGSQRLILAREGPPAEVEEMIAPVRTPSGEIAGVILTIRDTTRRREAEDQLSRSQKMDAIARLSGGVAGDFNNLLTVITGYGEMIRSESPLGNPMRRFAEEILFSADRAAALTRQLMAFSRHQSGQTRLLDVNASLANMQTMLKRLLGEKVNLMVLPGPGVGKVKADPGQLEQIIVNLAMNARDAMPNGGNFVIETAVSDLDTNSQGKPESLAPGQYVMMSVSDTGIGMDPETRSKLFEPFFTTKGQGKSTGLGLSIVYGIVRQGGGDVGVYSQPGSGTVFEIYLPKAKEQEPVSQRQPRAPRGTETILVADDDDGLRRLVHAVLATSGYTVHETVDGKEALAAYQADPDKYDLVLTDIVMPNLDGIALGEKIAQLVPEQKILYMSGFRDSPLGTVEQERLRLFLHKPFTPDGLLAKVREVLDGKAKI